MSEVRKRIHWSQQFVADKCCNCGSTENLMLHHVVPLAKGGTDAPGNLVVLCGKCHGLAHDRALFVNWKNEGRPKDELTPDRLEVLQLWADKKIGTDECKHRLGKTDGFRITSSSLWKTAIRDGLISDYDGKRNTLDIQASQSKRMESVTRNKKVKSTNEVG